MRLYDVIWKEKFVEKIVDKHNISTDEVEEVLFSNPHVRLAEKGQVKGEHLYVAYGQTAAGRYQVGIWLCFLSENVVPLPCQSQPVI